MLMIAMARWVTTGGIESGVGWAGVCVSGVVGRCPPLTLATPVERLVIVLLGGGGADWWRCGPPGRSSSGGRVSERPARSRTGSCVVVGTLFGPVARFSTFVAATWLDIAFASSACL